MKFKATQKNRNDQRRLIRRNFHEVLRDPLLAERGTRYRGPTPSGEKVQQASTRKYFIQPCLYRSLGSLGVERGGIKNYTVSFSRIKSDLLVDITNVMTLIKT